MKKIILFLFLLVPMLAQAYNVMIGGFCYSFYDDGTATVTDYSISNAQSFPGTAYIPPFVDYNGKRYSVTTISESAFSGCSGLNSVTIPNSVTSIGGWAFNGCSGLTSIAIPNSVVNIGNWAFVGCSRITSVSIPNSVTSIGDWVFADCSGLTDVTIPNSVTSIGEWSFSGCSCLTSVTIPESVTTISEGAFAVCPNLCELTCYAEEVPIIGNDTFYGTKCKEGTLYVPEGAVEAYKAASEWSDWGTITAIQKDYLGDKELMVNDPVTYNKTTSDFNHDGRVTAEDLSVAAQAIASDTGDNYAVDNYAALVNKLLGINQ